MGQKKVNDLYYEDDPYRAGYANGQYDAEKGYQYQWEKGWEAGFKAGINFDGKPAKLEIKVKYHADIDRLQKITIGDFIDLRCAENTFLMCGQYAPISLGVSIKLPKNHFALIVPRSSTFKNYGILMANGVGIVDGSYCGDHDIWHFLAYSTKDTMIPKNDRICQFMILPTQPELVIEEVDTLDGQDRGGIGSTGRT